MTNLLTYIFLFSFFSFGFNIDLTKPNELMNVLYHETTNFEEHNRKEQNAKNRGNTGAGIFSLKNFGNKNTNGMSKTEWIVANADKDTISTGTLGLVSDLYNTATKKGEGEPFIISSALTGLIVAGSLYSIQDSARKIYAWFDGEGYKGNTTYIDPIDGRTYTAEGNIKEGATDLIIGGVLYVGGKAVNKVGSKLMSKVDDALDIDHISGIGTDLKPVDKVNSFDNILKDSKLSTIQNSPKKVINYEKGGNALDDFSSINVVEPIHKNNAIIGSTKDGEIINLHKSTSLNGIETLEVYDNNINRYIDIRYK